MKKLGSLYIVLAITFAVFLPSLFGEFLAYDDELLLLDNPTVHGLSASNITEAFTTYDPELYIPLTLLTHQIEWSIVGDSSPLLYHITNLLLHLTSVVLVLLILRLFFDEKISVVCALLFAVHPLQVESVAWISGRKDLLASAFFLGSTYTYLQWKDGTRNKLLSVSLFTCGLLSKVSIFPLPLALLLLDYLKGEKISGSNVKEKIPYFALSVFFLVIAIVGKKAQVADPLSSIILSPAAFLLTIKHTLLPSGLSIFYPFIGAASLAHPLVLSGLALIAALLVFCILTRKRTPSVVFCVLWLGLLLTPSLVNMQRGGELGVPDLYLTSDRYVYLALLGPVFLIGYLLQKTSWKMPLLIILVFGALSVKQQTYWNNSTSLFQRVVDTHQPSHVAYTNLGGFAVQAGNIEEAEALFTEALSARRTTRALFNLAQIKAHLNKNDEALELYKELLILTPDDKSAKLKMQRLL